MARDGGNPQRSNRCLVVLNLVPVPVTSVNPPTILDPLTSSVTVLESDPIGHHVKLVNAQDDDGDTLWFDIVGKFPYQ